MSAEPPGHSSGPSPGNRLLVDDLATIATLRDTGIAVPEHLTAERRAEIRMLRQLLDGECVLVRELEGFTATLTGEPDAVMEEFLAQDGRGGRVNTGLRYQIQGRVFDLPDATLFHLNCRVVDREATLAALRAGEGEGRTLAIEAADGTPFRAFLPSAVKDPDAPLVPAPLGVPGIEDASGHRHDGHGIQAVSRARSDRGPQIPPAEPAESAPSGMP